MSGPFSMVLDGIADPEMTERDFIDLCYYIKQTLEFGIPFPNTMTEIRNFKEPDDSPLGYKNTFSFQINFPNHQGTRDANIRFIEDKLENLIYVLLIDYLPVAFETSIDFSGNKTYAVIKVP